MPLMESLWQRRCVEARVALGALFCGIGVVFVTKPMFLFGETVQVVASRDPQRMVGAVVLGFLSRATRPISRLTEERRTDGLTEG